MKKTIIAVLMAMLVLCMAAFVSAETIENGFELDVEVDDEEVKPGESFTVEIEVKNNNSADIEDIEVEIEIKDIDEGDDLDDDGDIDDLDDGDDDNIDFEFDVPYAVDDGDYEIIITVTGDDADNNSKDYRMVYNATVKVEKDKHELIMKEPNVDYETLKCSRTTEVSVTLYNIGTKDEDVDLEVYNTELGLSEKQSFELENGDDEDDIKTTRRFSLDLEDAKAKTYTVYVKAEYDDGDEQESETFSLKVEDCETTPVVEDDDDVIVQPAQPVVTQPVVTRPAVTVPAIVEEDTFAQQYGAALLLGLAYLVVIVIGVLLVVSLLKKR